MTEDTEQRTELHTEIDRRKREGITVKRGDLRSEDVVFRFVVAALVALVILVVLYVVVLVLWSGGPAL